MERWMDLRGEWVDHGGRSLLKSFLEIGGITCRNTQDLFFFFQWLTPISSLLYCQLWDGETEFLGWKHCCTNFLQLDGFKSWLIVTPLSKSQLPVYLTRWYCFWIVCDGKVKDVITPGHSFTHPLVEVPRLDARVGSHLLGLAPFLSPPN